jgi:hypothetical protein
MGNIILLQGEAIPSNSLFQVASCDAQHTAYAGNTREPSICPKIVWLAATNQNAVAGSLKWEA